MLRQCKVWKLTLLLGFVGAAGISAAQISSTAKPAQKKPPQVQAMDLHRGEEMVSTAPPIAVGGFGSKCDLEGNIYLTYASSTVVLSEPGAMGQLPLMEITPDTMEMVQYPVPPRIPDFQGHVSRLAFDVASDGTVYALFNTARRTLEGKMIPEFVIAKYNDDGTVDSYIHVVRKVNDEGLQPLRIAVFGNGDLLLSGTTVRKKSRPGTFTLGTFTGLFNRSGDLILMLPTGKTGMKVLHPHNAKPTEKNARPLTHSQALKAFANDSVALESSTLSFSAKDGNIYLLQGTGQATLYVVDSLGEILHKYPIQPPQAGLSPVQMAQAGPSHLYIDYEHIATGSPKENLHQRSRITVLSTATGKVTAVYSLPRKTGFLLPACAESSSKFTFLGTSKDKHLALITYSAQ